MGVEDRDQTTRPTATLIQRTAGDAEVADGGDGGVVG